MKIGGLIEHTNITFYTITSLQDQPGSAAKILKLFGQAGINLVYITEGACKRDMATLAFGVDSEDSQRVDSIIRSNVEVQSLTIIKTENAAMLGVYGPHFREKPAIAAIFCTLLGEAKINILGLSSSISTISCIIDIRELQRAKQALLQQFQLP
ncbi:MAG: hypothetical protein GF313_06685 [Caldithrix sp.]|nr:hypothetical protein [Caldithrix sp.]